MLTFEDIDYMTYDLVVFIAPHTDIHIAYKNIHRLNFSHSDVTPNPQVLSLLDCL